MGDLPPDGTFNRIALHRFGKESGSNFLPTFNARNPLKSPDSDERIQENPSKIKASNPKENRVRTAENLQNPRISKLTVRRRTRLQPAGPRLTWLRPETARPCVDEPKPAERERHEKAQRQNLDQRPLGGEVEDDARRRRRISRSLGPDSGRAPTRRTERGQCCGSVAVARSLPTVPPSRARGAAAGMVNAIVFLLTPLSSSSRRRPPGRERRPRARLHWPARLRSPKGPAPRFQRRRRVD